MVFFIFAFPQFFSFSTSLFAFWVYRLRCRSMCVFHYASEQPVILIVGAAFKWVILRRRWSTLQPILNVRLEWWMRHFENSNIWFKFLPPIKLLPGGWIEVPPIPLTHPMGTIIFFLVITEGPFGPPKSQICLGSSCPQLSSGLFLGSTRTALIPYPQDPYREVWRGPDERGDLMSLTLKCDIFVESTCQELSHSTKLGQISNGCQSANVDNKKMRPKHNWSQNACLAKTQILPEHKSWQNAKVG